MASILTPRSIALSQPASAERRAAPTSTSARARTPLLDLSTARAANALRAQCGAPIARAPRRVLAARAALGWAGHGPARDPEQRQRELDRALNLGALAALGAAASAQLLAADLSPWDAYSAAVATNPIEAKACISGAVYALGDLVAQSYEGRDVASWDRGRALRSGAVGFLAHGPLSHLYYLALDQAFAAQTLLPAGSWAIPALKIGIDQTLWSLLWNSTYYALLGALRMEPPAAIARSVRESYWDLLRAGWRLWPLVHVFTYGVIPVQHRLLFVDGVELVWVSVLSMYAQQQRRAAEGGGGGGTCEAPACAPPAVVACALPGAGGAGGEAAEEILRGLEVERRIVFEDAAGRRTVATPAEVYCAEGGADAAAP